MVVEQYFYIFAHNTTQHSKVCEIQFQILEGQAILPRHLPTPTSDQYFLSLTFSHFSIRTNILNRGGSGV